jgi:hypothetical protein
MSTNGELVPANGYIQERTGVCRQTAARWLRDSDVAYMIGKGRHAIATPADLDRIIASKMRRNEMA